MNFLKKIGGIFSKMTSRRNEKLVEAIAPKPNQTKEDSTRDIEDLVKPQNSSPFQTRSERMKLTKIKATASLSPGTPTKLKLRPIPLLQSGNLIKTNLDHNIKPTSQKSKPVRKSGTSLLSEAAASMNVSQTHSLGMLTVPSKKTMLAEFYHPMSEIDNKIRQSFDSEHGKCVEFTLVPSSDSNEEDNVNVIIDAKAVRKKEVEKLKSTMDMSRAKQDNELNKLEDPVEGAVMEKNPIAKPKQLPKEKKKESVKKVKPIENEKRVIKEESVKKQKTESKKKLSKEELKEKLKLSPEDSGALSVNVGVPTSSTSSKLCQELMPVQPKRVIPLKRTSKLRAIEFNPKLINANIKALKIKDPFEETKQETKAKGSISFRNSKPSLTQISDSEPVNKLKKWQPEKWQVAMENIRLMRTFEEAPVDRMGCHKCYDENVDEKTQRFQVLVALILSSQTRDQITYQVMLALRAMGCTPVSIVAMDYEKLMAILNPVSFYKSKAKYLQKTSKILIDHYDSDIPKNVTELIKLPGVGPKMAHICMAVAWDLITGIGVDTHVHRISNRLGWVQKPTKEPEQTRKQLELWLPSEHWREMNHLLVGFGQTFCTPVRPKCHQCLNNAFCPSANLMQKVFKNGKKRED